MKIIVYANQKGGVTKTTQAIAMALMGVLIGKKVALVDMDPQGNSTAALGYLPDVLEHTVYTGMRGQSSISQLVKKTYIHPESGALFDPSDLRIRESLNIHSMDGVINGPDLLPNNVIAASADLELQEEPAWGFLLKNLLSKLRGYDEIHIDTNPSLGRLTVNALLAATDIVIPMTAEMFSQQGMAILVQTIDRAQKNNPQLHVAGILFSRVRYASHRTIMAAVRDSSVPGINAQFPRIQLSTFQHHINEAAAFGEAQLRQSSVLLTDASGPISAQHWAAYAELLERIQGTGQDAARQILERIQTQAQAQAK